MGIIDDHYGGYENLALYSDGHGGFDMDAACGTTLESTIDADPSRVRRHFSDGQ